MMQQYRPFGKPQASYPVGLLDAGYEDNDPRRALTLGGGGASGATPNADALGQFAYGLTNLGGLQDAAGLLGGPSLRENLAAGNTGTAALQGVGAIPVVGGAAKLAMAFLPKAATAGAKVAKAAEAAADAPGIIAYHGSPHSFDRFDMSKIGTGEGAQVYGHGLYFADNEDVARAYRENLSRQTSYAGDSVANSHPSDSPFATALHAVSGHVANGMAPREAMALEAQQWRSQAQTYADFGRQNPAAADRAADQARKFEEIASHIEALDPSKLVKNPGSMYQVRINADPEHFLNYDRPLSEQSPAVQQIIGNIPAAPDREAWPFITGNDLHEQLRVDAMGDDAFMSSSDYRRQRRNEAAVDVSKTLRDAGIPGIKYLDQGSRYIPQNLPDNPIANEARQFLGEAGGDYGKALEAFRASNPADRFASSERDEIEKVIKAAAKQPTHNYVVFDDKLIEILKKYGLVGLLGGGAAINAQPPNAPQSAPLL